MESAMQAGYRHVFQAAAFALILLCAFYPDVIFGGASLRVTDQLNAQALHLKAVKPFPVPDHIDWWSSQADTGGAAFQSEPMAEFVKAAFKNGDSIYWNPYAGTGAFGPEALVDLKLSISSVLYAMLGGDSFVYNIIYLFGYFVGIFALFSACRLYLGMSATGAAGSCVFFLMNGYATASTGSNVVQSYPYAPLLLVATLAVIQRQRLHTIALFACALAISMSFSFLPTTITTILAVAAIGSASLLKSLAGNERPYHQLGQTIGSLFAGVLIALMIVSPIYLPLLENLKTSGILSDYQKRLFFNLSFPEALTTFLSPSLFYESYNAMEERARGFLSGMRPVAGNVSYHMGITSIFLAAGCLSLRKVRESAVPMVCILLITATLLRLFNPDFMDRIFSKIPVIGNIGCQYWWPTIVIPLALLVGYGLDRFLDGTFSRSAITVMSMLFIAAGAFVWGSFGMGGPYLPFKMNVLYGTICLTLILFVFTYMADLGRGRMQPVLAGLIVLLMFGELVIDAKVVRYPRNDFFSNLPPAVQFVKDNVGLQRTMNLGQTGLYPELGSALGVQEVSSMTPGNMPAYLNYFYSAVDLQLSQRLGVSEPFPRGAFPTFLVIRDEPDANKLELTKLSFLGLKYVLVPTNFPKYKKWFLDRGFRQVFDSPATWVLENPSPMPRAFFTASGQSAEQDVSVPEIPDETTIPAQIVAYRNTHVTLEGSAPRDGVVVLSDSWHPLWLASVNGGKQEQVLRVNGNFRGIKVPAGAYRIELDYRPATATPSKALFFAGLLLVVAGFLTALLRQVGVFSKTAAFGG